MKLLTTHQQLYKLRKQFSDSDILKSLCDCPRGVKMALESLINKEYCGSDVIIERVELVDADIIEEMRN